jgi:hypothetical protein
MWAMQGLLFCVFCTQPLHPLRTAVGPPAYRSVCGCRLHPIDAQTVEARVRDAAEARFPALTACVPGDCRAALYRDLLTEVSVGTTADDLTFRWRT